MCVCDFCHGSLDYSHFLSLLNESLGVGPQLLVKGGKDLIGFDQSDLYNIFFFRIKAAQVLQTHKQNNPLPRT